MGLNEETFSSAPRLLAIIVPAWLCLPVWLCSCVAPSPVGGYPPASPPTAAQPAPARPVPSETCAQGVAQGIAGSPCSSTTGINVPALPSPSPTLLPSPAIPSPGAPAPTGQQSLPKLGSPIFGPTGLIGTVINQSGSTAVVAPVGGGAPGIYVPNGNGTATIFQPGGVPVVVPVR